LGPERAWLDRRAFVDLDQVAWLAIGHIFLPPRVK
jgi:hypothetical protein